MSDLVAYMERVIDRKLRPSKYLGFYRYRVNSDNGPGVKSSRPDLRPVDTSLGLPDLLATDKALGCAGVFSKLRQTSEVLVGFEGGRPSAPFVAWVLPVDAQEVELSSSGKVRVTSSKFDLVQLVAEPVAIASKVTGAVVRGAESATAIVSWAALVTAIVEPPVGPPGPIAVSLANAVAKVGAFAAIASSLGSDFPVGCASTKLESV